MPAPWNSGAIKATYDRVDLDDKNQLNFRYILENPTDLDYSLETYSHPSFAARLEDSDSLVGFGSESVKIDLPVYVPAHRKSIVIVSTPDYGLTIEKLSENASAEERKKFHKALETFISEKMTNLNGFALFNNTLRYEIDF